MSDSNDSTTGTEEKETPERQEQTGGGDTTELTPDALKKELEKVRKEAANYRTRLRDAEAKLADAKTPEEFEAARAEFAEANKKLERELMVERAGRGLPDELRALLKGDTEEELKAHAEVLKKFVPAQELPPEKLSGGLNAGGRGDDFDVKDVAKRVRLGRL